MAVEQAVFAHFKHDESADYKKKIRSLFANLKNKSNSALRARVFSGEISAQKFATMTDDELKSEEQRKMDAELEKENMKKAQVPQEQKSISDSLQCGRCKLKKVSYTQAQTRSADEPMTTFCECMNCGHRWKVFSPFLIPTPCFLKGIVRTKEGWEISDPFLVFIGWMNEMKANSESQFS